MLEWDEAAQRLTPLAKPTLEAFAESRQIHQQYLTAMEGIRERMSFPVRAVSDGVSYWGPFATVLDEKYAAIPGVVRDHLTHPLLHQWAIDGEVVVQLKSDTHNLPLIQPMLPGMKQVGRIEVEHVVLTWDHDHVERFDPAFVQLDGRREIWRMPVAALLEDGDDTGAAPVVVLRPNGPRPRPTVSSTKPKVAKKNTEEDSPAGG